MCQGGCESNSMKDLRMLKATTKYIESLNSLIDGWVELTRAGAILSLVLMAAYAIIEHSIVRAIIVSIVGGTMVMVYYMVDWGYEAHFDGDFLERLKKVNEKKNSIQQCWFVTSKSNWWIVWVDDLTMIDDEMKSEHDIELEQWVAYRMEGDIASKDKGKVALGS